MVAGSGCQWGRPQQAVGVNSDGRSQRASARGCSAKGYCEGYSDGSRTARACRGRRRRPPRRACPAPTTRIRRAHDAHTTRISLKANTRTFRTHTTRPECGYSRGAPRVLEGYLRGTQEALASGGGLKGVLEGELEGTRGPTAIAKAKDKAGGRGRAINSGACEAINSSRVLL
jgi:hypothetical protein